MAGDPHPFDAGRQASQIAALEERVAALQAALNATHASASWLVTAPLRGLVQRNAALYHRLHGLAARAWRPTRLRPPAERPAPPIAEAVSPSSLPTQPGLAAPLLWFHVGDTLDWFVDHEHLTGVGRVTSKILAAAVAEGAPWHPSVLHEGVLVRAETDPDQTAQGGSAAAKKFRTLVQQAPRAPRDPTAGDHVVFTGIVWTPTYVELFERLRAQGVRFSVLLYDLIPLQRADLVSPAHARSFELFVSMIVREAEAIFTSADTVRVQLARWLVAEGTTTRHQVQVIGFGVSLPYQHDPVMVAAPVEPFALCVGTIDQRKNQLPLCRTWARLAATREVPALVLVGRDDIGLQSADPAVAALVASGVIRVLTDVDDAALDALYRAAWFTVFPSVSEGYGLPVADSLAYGKLCLAADLPVIREWAGDFPWYFDPFDPEALSALLQRVLDDAAAVGASQARIAGWQPKSWGDTVRAIGDEASRHLGVSAEPHLVGPPPLPPPTAETVATMARADRWCVAERPEVSIVIVHRGAVDRVLACIRRLWARTADATYEIIITHDGSTPDGDAALGELGAGIRRLPVGIDCQSIKARNIAAEAARGDFVCFLSSDVVVGEGWLSGLLQGLRANPHVGAVGPAAMHPRDRGETVLDQRVDYVPAACLLMRQDLFMRVGGFDRAFEPAGFEDADLCLKLASFGRSSMLVGTVEVGRLHHGPSPDGAACDGTLRATNRGEFLSRWQAYLHSRDPALLEAVGTRLLHQPSPASSGLCLGSAETNPT